jgi:glutamine amidotransferase
VIRARFYYLKRTKYHFIYFECLNLSEEQMKSDLVIVDYGMGNLFSVQKVVHRLGYKCIISGDPDIVSDAAKIILPGVGHFGRAIENLRKLNLIEPLSYLAIDRKIPVLGICLGMQLMSSSSEEGDMPGLGWIPGMVSKFHPGIKSLYKVPHTGWNTLTYRNLECTSLDGIGASDEFYFVHSYFYQAEDANHILCKTKYDIEFVSGIQRENIIGYQFHPEKSHEAGAKLIHNFLKQ